MKLLLSTPPPLLLSLRRSSKQSLAFRRHSRAKLLSLGCSSAELLSLFKSFPARGREGRKGRSLSLGGKPACPKRSDRVERERERKQSRKRRRRRRSRRPRFFLLSFFFFLCLSRCSHDSPLHPRQLRPTPNPQPAQQNPLTSGSPLEALKKKTDAAYTWVQDETAEVANTGYRLKTIYYANKTIPRSRVP